MTASQDMASRSRGEEGHGSALEASGLTKSFGGVTAVAGVSMTVAQGSITAVIGPNGAGKTSLFNLLTGFERADQGTIELFGRPIHKLPARAIARAGMVRSFQTPVGFPKLTVRENLLVAGSRANESLLVSLFAGRRWRGAEREVEERVRSVLADLGIESLRDTLLEDLTGGDIKLVDFGRLLMMNPTLLLLDEPAAGVDPGGIDRLAARIKRLRQGGITVLIIDHNIQFVLSVAEYIYVMAEGQVIVEGTPEHVIADPTVTRIYLGGDK